MRKIISTKEKTKQGNIIGKSHMLKEHSYKGFVRTNFCTPIFGGKPILECPKDDFDAFDMTEE